MEDTLKLQKDIDRLGIWTRKWGMRFQPVKSNMMQLTKKHNKIQASHTLEGIVLENVESIKYLSVTITSDLKWNSHIRHVCSKAKICWPRAGPGVELARRPPLAKSVRI